MQKILTATLLFLINATAAFAAPDYSPPQPCGTQVCQPGYQCCRTVDGVTCAKLRPGTFC
ncbi:hypothetical protein CPB83DRAFT_852781 [Crepidotus variabilis]|uniref:Uncharacterized protein n=1 Tax=Crepidotus variabilis TaxID=179855 RepID=A0A9P6JQC9_9AGAR|nr:hypothetical protein CPB83DRAFT_852781 [Crepidotus variabilis]